ncbi:phospholipase D family protein [Tritonibacter mobilis]|uniref:phospholipase D family protein n=1 Tax=Tritonibacter mobilis TaxID=379347 RepID=UPI000806CFA6|nr:phospholipase D family protein [Tritonibacter mobilis]
MKLILVPSDQEMNLRDEYEKAFSEATELYVLSAYLTHWNFQKKLNSGCRKFRLIVGTDFGITRKQALYDALKWVPRNQKCNFLAVDKISGFHPKVAFWKDKNNEFHCVIGSSNQTHAAFNTNFEANAVAEISSIDFMKSAKWVQDIVNHCSQVNEQWIADYKEGNNTPRNNENHKIARNQLQDFGIHEPTHFKDFLLDRRRQMRAYSDARSDFIELVEECAAGQLSSHDFYRDFTNLWGKDHYISFQSDAWKRRGKSSSFSEICRSLVEILSTKDVDLDDVVRVELDRLDDLKIETRKSLFTEILCKEFPNQFPVWNARIEKRVAYPILAFPPRSSFGSKYIHMAREMRRLVKCEDSPVNDLAELDLLIGLQDG